MTTPRHGCQGVFFSYRSAAGAPYRERWYSSHQMNRVLTIPASKLNTTIYYENAITFSSCMVVSQGESCLFSWEMFLKNLNAHGSFTPTASVPLYAMPPEQVLPHHRFLSAGAARGDRNCPVLRPSCAFYSIPWKRRSPEPILSYFIYLLANLPERRYC